MADTIRAALVKAIAAQDVTAIAACFTDDAQIRALVPHALRERTGGTETAALIARWFGDSTELDLIDSHSGEVGGKFHVSYRFQGIEEGKPYVIEQQLYCTLRDGKIQRVDLLCSGFLPRPTV